LGIIFKDDADGSRKVEAEIEGWSDGFCYWFIMNEGWPSKLRVSLCWSMLVHEDLKYLK
jgi:hypothetical protein